MPSSSRIPALALMIYVPLGAAAIAWASLLQERSIWTLSEPWLDSPIVVRAAASLALGLGLAVVVISTTPALIERTAWARALHRELAPIVKELSQRQIFLLALTSGVAEELFFRGAMQPALGLLLTSVLFGLAHTGPKRVFLAWSLWAFIMGLLFGLIFELTGVLWGPILSHVVINDRNMTYMRGH